MIISDGTKSIVKQIKAKCTVALTRRQHFTQGIICLQCNDFQFCTTYGNLVHITNTLT